MSISILSLKARAAAALLSGALFLLSAAASAQGNLTVTGTVREASVTDLDGTYRITGVKPDAVITVTAIGYKTLEEPVNGRNRIDFILEGDFLALNDAVVTKGAVARVIQTSVLLDGVEAMNFSGDGLIAATPTGSTAYSMSAGGPIVEPQADNIILTPICAHTLSAKPFVLSPQRKVRVLTEKLTGRRAYLAVDGYQVADLESGDILNISKADCFVQMINPVRRSFYDQLEKLV